jgi:hypothetical protein
MDMTSPWVEVGLRVGTEVDVGVLGLHPTTNKIKTKMNQKRIFIFFSTRAAAVGARQAVEARAVVGVHSDNVTAVL